MSPNDFDSYEGRDPEKELRSLQQRFRAIRKAHDRKVAWQHLFKDFRREILLGVTVFLGTFCLFWFSPFTVIDTAKHLAAFPNCSFARAVGLAPSHKGQPGYWESNDADDDGIACEVWPRP